MFLIILAFICALSISGVAIYYSVLGLAAIFAAAKIPIYIMGTVLEVAKLVTASWLYQNWKNIPFLIKTYLTVAVGVLMIITSLGIFGFLSKAHIEQATPAANIVASIDNLDERILREQSKIENLTSKIARMEDGGSGNADEQIAREQQIIDTANEKISADVELIQTQIANTQTQIDSIQADVDKKIELARTDSKESIAREQNKLDALEKAVSDVLNANKSFFNEEKEAALLKESQGPERTQISTNIINLEQQLNETITGIQAKADSQIDQLRAKIDGFNAEISSLQASVSDEVALAKQRINEINTSAINNQENSTQLIAGYEQEINQAYENIDELNADKFVFEAQIRELSAEVGPIKYIAQFFDTDGEVDLERAVTWLIIVIMFVFDPLAVLLLIAVNMSLKARYGWSFEGETKQIATSKSEPTLVSKKKINVDKDSVIVKKSILRYYHDLLDKTAKRLAEKPKEKIVEKIVEKPVVKKVEIESSIDTDPPADIQELESRVLNKIKHKGDEYDK